ncbi:diacylglycerol kinase family protein [Vagococcus intermedius]|uniref:Diacylglycerol kinase family protein n=1 Tax=Vagococcus intermedius TaxID=2991418 RepID=A0AAF0CWF0_9ENTE|nr:diacylglycerol kinase family protein [Vagococcus intermedius]WEG73942.1 diacylglycerol kinase family protein [Vagococcus intermedius]WEG76022.1 diacylglycerol kinase family protein [Vagococcus intermedius]
MDLRDKKVSKNKNLLTAAKHACDGLLQALQEERNLKIHVGMAVVISFLGVAFQLSLTEWRWLMLIIFLVILMEMLNTITENLVDLITGGKYHPLAKKVKDMAAGVVLLSAVLALAVGSLIFIPKIINWLYM